MVDKNGAVLTSLNSQDKEKPFLLENNALNDNLVKINVKNTDLYLVFDKGDDILESIIYKNLSANLIAFALSSFICVFIYLRVRKTPQECKQDDKSDDKNLDQIECEKEQTQNQLNVYMEKILAYIDDNISDEQINIDRLSKTSGYSKFHLQRVFKGYVGENVASYLKQARLNKSAFMLKYCEDKILDIATKCGFSYEHSYIRAFEKQYGKTPNVFRNEAASSLHKSARFSKDDYEIVELKDINIAYVHYTQPNLNVSKLKAANLIHKNVKNIVIIHQNDVLKDGLNIYRIGVETNAVNQELPVVNFKAGKFIKLKFDPQKDDLAFFVNKIYTTFWLDEKREPLDSLVLQYLEYNPLDENINTATSSFFYIKI